MEKTAIQRCAFLLILIVFAIAMFVPGVDALAASDRVLMIGDSHTAGPFGQKMDELLKGTGATVETFGCVGASARQYVSGSGYDCTRGSRYQNDRRDYPIVGVDAHLARMNPNVVIIALGANYARRPSERIREETSNLIAKVQGKTCFWVGPAQSPLITPQQLESFYDDLESVKGHCTIIDSRPFTEFNFCGQSVCCCDADVHFKSHGAEGTAVARSWADNIFRTLQGMPVTVAAGPAPSTVNPPSSGAAQQGAPAAESSGTAGDGFPRCEGANMEQVSDLSGNVGPMARCDRHRELFDRYARQNGLYDMGLDLLTLYMIAAGESRCRTAEEQRQEGSSTADGGIMQVDYPCLREPGSCPTLESEIDQGTQHLARGLRSIMNQGYTGEEALTLLLFGYNRGPGAQTRAINKMQEEDMGLLEACDEACSYYYGYPGTPAQGECGSIRCSSGSHCSQGRRCDYEWYCGKDSRNSAGEIYAVHYATQRIELLGQACTQLGGRMTEEPGDPSAGPAAESRGGCPIGTRPAPRGIAGPVDSETPAPTAAPTTPSQPAQQGGCGSKIFLVGDSITVGNSYKVHLQRLCGEGTEIRNEDGDSSTSQETPAYRREHGTGDTPLPRDKFASKGKHTYEMQQDFADVLAQGPDTVIIMGGTNDLGNAQGIINSLESMYEAAGDNVRVVAVTVPPFKTAAERQQGIQENIDQVNDWILQQSPADVKVDTYSHLVAPGTDDVNTGLFARDKYHPVDAGHQIIAQKIYEMLAGGAQPASPAPAAGGEGGAGESELTCIPESILPSILFDLMIESGGGWMTVHGIARQHIAVGIEKDPPSLPPGAVCAQVDAELDYDMDYLSRTYGGNPFEIEPQLQTVRFLGKSVEVHRKIVPALACVQSSIQQCEEARNYPIKGIASYEWLPLDSDPDLLATSSFGIAIDINPPNNLNSQDGVTRSDLPECFVEAFKNHGFRWGGDYASVSCPMHFEFMARPDDIVIQTQAAIAGSPAVRAPSEGGPAQPGGAAQPGTPGQQSSVTVGGVQCPIPIPADLDTQSIGPPSGGGSLDPGYELPRETDTIKFYKAEQNRRNWATVEFGRGLFTAGCVVKENYGVQVGFGDLSQEGGGDVSGHQSHESGRGGDISFVHKAPNRDTYTPAGPWAAVPRSTQTCEQQSVSPAFDRAANYALLKAWHQVTPFRFVFLDCNIKEALKRYAQENFPGEWEELGFQRIIRHAPNHHHHYHIRIDCPEGDERCRP